jgi:hypothetical protein
VTAAELKELHFDYMAEMIITYRLRAMFRPRAEWPNDGIIAQMEAAKDLPPAVLTLDDLLRWRDEL